MAQRYEKLLKRPNLLLISFLEEEDVLDVGGMGEHIDGLDSGHAVVGVEIVQVTRLCGGVARHVDDTLWGGLEDGLHHVWVHAGAWRVGDDYIRTSVFGDELVGQYVLHVAGVEERVSDTVDL